MRLTITGPKGFTAVLEEKGDYHVGRSGVTTCVSRLDDLEETYQEIVVGNGHISKDHLVISIFDEGVGLTDLGSMNGSFLNGKAFGRGYVRFREEGYYELKLGKAKFDLKYER